MKKAIGMLLLLSVLLFSALLFSCTDSNSESVLDDMTGEEIIERMYEQVSTGLTMNTTGIDIKNNDLFKYHFFIGKPDSVSSAIISTPELNNIPCFVGIIKFNDTGDIEKTASGIRDNVNYEKLICASFKAAYVEYSGNTLILIADIDAERAELLKNAFLSLAGQ